MHGSHIGTTKRVILYYAALRHVGSLAHLMTGYTFLGSQGASCNTSLCTALEGGQITVHTYA